jgi:PhnB protein
MTTSIQPYLFFDGRCEEAIEFYRRALGATVTMLVRWGENPTPNPSDRPMPAEKIMHANLQIGEATVLVSDGHCRGKPIFEGFSLSLTVGNEAEADRAFNALSDGGQVRMPLGATFFSPRFGMLADRFGIAWMVYVAPPRKP